MAAGATEPSPGYLRQRFLGQPCDVERTKAKHADAARDVLHRLFAQVGEGERKLVANLLVGTARDAQTARLAQGLEPRRDVYAVAEYVVAIDDDVADIDADAENDPPIPWHCLVSADHAALDADGAADRVDYAGELDQHPVARCLHDAAVMPGDGWIDQFAAMRLERT